MTIALRNFNTSGNLANGKDDMQRDLQFWNDFCHGDATLFYIYMAWDHGKQVPAWNSALLPEAQRIDLGVVPTEPLRHVQPSPGGSVKQGKRGRDNNDADGMRDFVDMQAELFKSIASNPSSATTEASLPEVLYSAKVEALSKAADILRAQLRQAVDDRYLLAPGGALPDGALDDGPVFDYEGHVKALRKQLLSVVTSMSQVSV